MFIIIKNKDQVRVGLRVVYKVFVPTKIKVVFCKFKIISCLFYDTFKQCVNLFHQLYQDNNIVCKPKVIDVFAVDVDNFFPFQKLAGVFQSGNKTVLGTWYLFSDSDFVGLTQWHFYTNTSTLRYTESQYDIAGGTQEPPTFRPNQRLSRTLGTYYINVLLPDFLHSTTYFVKRGICNRFFQIRS